MKAAKLRSAQVALFARIKKVETMALAQSLTTLGQVLRAGRGTTISDFPGRAAAIARLEELDKKESELTSRTGWAGAVAKVEVTALRNRRSKELQGMARAFLQTGAASAALDELPPEVVRAVGDVREVEERLSGLKKEAEDLARQVTETWSPAPHAPEGSGAGRGPSLPATHLMKRSGMAVGVLIACILMVVFVVGSQRTERDREEQEYVRKKEESRQRALAQVPSFEASLKKGVEAFGAGQHDQAEAAFFEGERIGQKIRDEDWESYYEGKWAPRLAQAKLGRAAVVLARGSDTEGAQALIKSAYDVSSDTSFPVLSAPGEALLAQVKQRSREENDQWLQERRKQEEQEKVTQSSEATPSAGLVTALSEIPSELLGTWEIAGTDVGGNAMQGRLSMEVRSDWTATEHVHGSNGLPDNMQKILSVERVGSKSYTLKTRNATASESVPAGNAHVVRIGNRLRWSTAPNSPAWYEKDAEPGPMDTDRASGSAAPLEESEHFVANARRHPEAYRIGYKAGKDTLQKDWDGNIPGSFTRAEAEQLLKASISDEAELKVASAAFVDAIFYQEPKVPMPEVDHSIAPWRRSGTTSVQKPEKKSGGMFSSYYDIGELRNYLIGKSKDEVTDLLGKPDTGGDTMWRYAKGN